LLPLVRALAVEQGEVAAVVGVVQTHGAVECGGIGSPWLSCCKAIDQGIGQQSRVLQVLGRATCQKGLFNKCDLVGAADVAQDLIKGKWYWSGSHCIERHDPICLRGNGKPQNALSG